MKRVLVKKHNHHYEHDGKEYIISKEIPRSEGGTGLWYCIIIDTRKGYGACIDERVPDGFYPRLKDAKQALIEHVTK